MNSRSIGYYWIEVNRYGWVVGYWNGGRWLIPQDKYPMPDYAIFNIDETPITRYNDNNKKVGNA